MSTVNIDTDGLYNFQAFSRDSVVDVIGHALTMRSLQHIVNEGKREMEREKVLT